MTPNVNVYGAPSTWVHVLPPSGYTDDHANFVPQWRTIAGGINAGKVDYSAPLDNSICYAAIAEDSPAAGVYFAAGNALTVPVENKPYAENFFLSTGDYSTGFTFITYYDITDNFPAKYVYNIGGTAIAQNPNFALQPLCSASLKDLVMCVYVVGANSDYTDFRTSTYNGYKQQYSASHPNIIRVYGVPYARLDGISGRSALSNSEAHNFSGFARMGKYTLPNNNGEVYDYNASISHSDGLAFLMWGMPLGSDGNYYGNSPNYIYRGIGSGGSFVGANGVAYYSRPWGAAYQEHAGDDWIRRVAASYGVFFVDRTSYAQTAAYASANMCLGTIDENGLCHGDYTTGADNTEQPQYIWDSTNDSPFDPNQEYDDTRYNRTSTLNSQTIETFNTIYVIDSERAHKLAAVLGSAMASRPAGTTAADWATDTFLTNNPLDCIVSLKKFPCYLPRQMGTAVPIYFGSYSDNRLDGYLLSDPYKKFSFDFSTNDRNFLRPVFGDNFLDYEPYTHATLYIPFCGTIDVPISEFMGHSLTVDLLVDFITGACCAYVKRDGMFVTSATGNCAVDIAVSGIEGATLDSQIFHAAQNMKAARFNATAATVGLMTSTVKGASNLSAGSLSAATGAVDGFTSGLQRAEMATLQKQSAEYEQSHIQTPFKQVTGASPLLSQLCEYCCRLIIYRPIIADEYDPDVYGSTVGFACIDNDYVKNFEGFTVANNVDLNGVNCSAEEKTELLSLFAGGVYL